LKVQQGLAIEAVKRSFYHFNMPLSCLSFCPVPLRKAKLKGKFCNNMRWAMSISTFSFFVPFHASILAAQRIILRQSADSEKRKSAKSCIIDATCSPIRDKQQMNAIFSNLLCSHYRLYLSILNRIKCCKIKQMRNLFTYSR
jgi:hypothetical protein